MIRYIFKRIFLAAGILLFISLVTFFILAVVPGDVVAAMLGEFADAQQIADVKKQMGLDAPVFVQYVNWLADLLHGNLGVSYFQKKPVAFLITDAFRYTFCIAFWTYLIALVIGITLGMAAALARGTVLDRCLMTISVFGISMPSFWVAILLQIYIGLKFHILPVSGVSSPLGYVLPCLALGTRYSASISRITRTSVLEVIGQDFVKTAWAKGLHASRIVMFHIFRNAMIPIVTISGTEIGSLLTGSMITENVFNIPGVGKLLIDAIYRRDIPLVQGTVMYVATVCVIIYFIVDILYAVINPNVRLASAEA